jgi:hypothetical protein
MTVVRTCGFLSAGIRIRRGMEEDGWLEAVFEAGLAG